jgi:hypothetical protein
MGEGLVYLLEMAQVIAVLGFGNESGYGEVYKVRISRMANIPTIIDFGKKMSKSAKEVDK